MIIVKRDLLSFLKRPLAPVFFGSNKTYRGFLFVPLVNGFVLFIFDSFLTLELPFPSFVFGLLLGLAYLVFELPNSYIKRKLGIAPGAKSDRHKNLFIILDRCDSAFGVSFLYVLLLNLAPIDFIFLFGLAFVVHFFFSFLMVKLGVKESL